MSMMLRRGWTYRGCDVVDAAGTRVGTVTDLWPHDGGGEPELLLVEIGGRFKRPRYLPVAGTRLCEGRVHVKWSRVEIDEAPSAEDRRWGDPAHVAVAYWRDSSD
jgi:hypothetical protein